MKRTQPGSENSCLKRQFPPYIPVFDWLPRDVIQKNILIPFLNSRDIVTVSRTYRYLYTTSTDEGLWQSLFFRDFGGAPRIALDRGWREEYQLQNLFGLRLSQKIFASRIFPIGQNGVGITTFVATHDGRFVMGYQDGSVKIFDPRTNDWVQLSPTLPTRVDRLFCKEYFCVAQDQDGLIRAWDIKTCEEIPVPKDFSQLGTKDQMTLVQGKLLGCSNNKNTIEIWDLKEKKDLVRSIPFKKAIRCMTFCNQTLFCIREDWKLETYHLEKNHRKIYTVIIPEQNEFFPKLICAVSETKVVFFNPDCGNMTTQCVEGLDNPSTTHYPPLLNESPPSLPNDPNASLDTHTPLLPREIRNYSLAEFSSFFQAFSASPFYRLYLFGKEDLTDLSRFRGEALFPSPFVCGHGGLYSLCSDRALLKDISDSDSEDEIPERHFLFCADFTAPIKDAFWELAELFLDQNPFTAQRSVESAKQRYNLMPKAVQDRLSNAYAKVAFIQIPHLHPKPSGTFWMDVILEYLTPGSVIKDQDVLGKVATLLGSKSGAERDTALERYSSMIPQSVQKIIQKLSESLSNRPEHRGKTGNECLQIAISEYLAPGYVQRVLRGIVELLTSENAEECEYGQACFRSLTPDSVQEAIDKISETTDLITAIFKYLEKAN